MVSMKSLNDQIETMPDGPEKDRARLKLQKLRDARSAVAKVKKHVRDQKRKR